MNLSVCGVDIIPSSRGPLILEVNSSPGLEGIEKTTGVDVAGKIMDYIQANVSTLPDNKKRCRKKDDIGA